MLSSRAFLCGLVMTLVPMFDVPVFWPVLLVYWIILVFVTMRRQVRHMIKHKYIPFDLNRKKVRHTSSDQSECSCAIRTSLPLALGLLPGVQGVC
jgi:hypothetical protein